MAHTDAQLNTVEWSREVLRTFRDSACRDIDIGDAFADAIDAAAILSDALEQATLALVQAERNRITGAFTELQQARNAVERIEAVIKGDPKLRVHFAFASGKSIVFRPLSGFFTSDWRPCQHPTWNWELNEYKVAE